MLQRQATRGAGQGNTSLSGRDYHGREWEVRRAWQRQNWQQWQGKGLWPKR